MRKRSKKDRKLTCCSCGKLKERPKQGYCNECRNKWSRAKRKRHSNLPINQKQKANARAYLNVYIRRGKIIKGCCCVCGSPDVESHHIDYSKPLEVIWYCREHHLDAHLKNG